MHTLSLVHTDHNASVSRELALRQRPEQGHLSNIARPDIRDVEVTLRYYFVAVLHLKLMYQPLTLATCGCRVLGHSPLSYLIVCELRVLPLFLLLIRSILRVTGSQVMLIVLEPLPYLGLLMSEIDSKPSPHGHGRVHSE